MRIGNGSWLLAAVVVAGAALGTVLALRGEVHLGVELAADGERVVVADVRPGGMAARAGVRRGAEVLGLNGPEPPSGGGFPLVTTDGEGDIDLAGDPPREPVPESEITFLLTGVVPSDGEPNDRATAAVALRRSHLNAELRASGWELVAGAVIVAASWLWYRRSGSVAARLATGAAAVVAVSLFVLPARLSGIPEAQVLGVLLVGLALMTLAWRLIRRGVPARLRPATATACLGLVCVGSLIAIGVVVGLQPRGLAELTAGTLLAASVLVPAGVVASRVRSTTAGVDALLARLDVVVTAAVVGITLFFAAIDRPSAAVALIATGSGLAVRRFAALPFSWLAKRAEIQRTAVVAAAEAERAHLSAELHDDIIQDFSLLIRRLRSAGDPESVEAARDIAARLRGVSGQLHLPILDDLGLGPALEWLVDRTRRLGVPDVGLEVHDGDRLPAEVELAIFRVAQEALSNAIRHGDPPFLVRCETQADCVVLTIRDGGTGVNARLEVRGADQHGLATMEQRAEQIGALLTIRSLPKGGSQVRLEWRRP